MAVHRGPASLQPRCTWGGSRDANLPSTTLDGGDTFIVPSSVVNHKYNFKLYFLNNIFTHRTVQVSPPFSAVLSGLFERSSEA
jgi:hypothetical protein